MRVKNESVEQPPNPPVVTNSSRDDQLVGTDQPAPPAMGLRMVVSDEAGLCTGDACAVPARKAEK